LHLSLLTAKSVDLVVACNDFLPKGTSWAEAVLKSEKIKLVALAVIELC